MTLNHPKYIAVEGMIGVGKTTLAKILAEKLEMKLMLEEVENPFLPKFYEDPTRYAFQTQMFFLLSRYRQQQRLIQPDLFESSIVSDYLFAKDRIFAHVNLGDEELALYERLATLLEKDIPKPDLVIYLQSNIEKLTETINQRARDNEREIDSEYLQNLNDAYNHFFFHYDETTLLVVRASDIDFLKDTEGLISQIENPFVGTKYYVPMGSQRML